MRETHRPSLPALARATAARLQDAVAIDFLGKTSSFAQVDAASDRIAAGLAARNVQPGERIALYCINSDSFALVYLGIVKAGAVVVPLNLLQKPVELEFILRDAGVTTLIYHEAFADNVSALRDKVAGLDSFFYIGSNPSRDTDTAWTELLESTDTVPEIDADPDRDAVCFLYTSGTTGKPKGAMLSHTNLVSNTAAVMQALKLTAQDRILTVLPMFHAFAANVGMLVPLLHGCCTIPVPKFDLQLVADRIQDGNATVFLGVPSMYAALLNLKHDQVSKLSSLRFCVSGGAAMPQQVMKDFETKFHVTIHEGDGPTECSPVTAVNPIGGTRKPASIGPPIPGVEMSILDLEGNPVPDNAVGEICVRGPNIMLGYWNQPGETAAAFHDNWFRTGDLGTRDADNYFYIVDRIKDMVIVNGMNVYPRMVEEVLYQFEPIAEAAVIGEPHELHGEIPVAYVALKPEQHTDVAAVRAFCREHLGNHEVPRKVIFMEALPKNAAGKILKRELRKQGELERGVDSRDG